VLVPPPHDDRPQVSAPMIATPNAFLTAQHPVGGVGSRRPVQPCPDPRLWLILTHSEHAAGRLGLCPDAPPRYERARERRIHKVEHIALLSTRASSKASLPTRHSRNRNPQ
jgi:hypothetical protein